MNIDESFRELGLAPGCSDAELKEAWRRLAARWHPDRNASPQALRKIQRINRAVAEIRRWKADAAPAGEPTHDSAQEHRVERSVTVTLEEACAGCSRRLRRSGRGLRGLHRQQPAGRPRVAAPATWQRPPATPVVGLAVGFLRMHGLRRAGQHGRPAVPAPAASRAQARKYRCRVEVPAGTAPGSVLEVSARVQGRQRLHALALRVRVELQPHPFFTLDADGTVRCELPVDGFAWMAERWTDVPTPRSPQHMRLRRGALLTASRARAWPKPTA